MAAFLANVGANASHRWSSPLRADGAFTVLPIPETGKWGPPVLRAGDVPRLRPFLPAGFDDARVHLDPDLDSEVPSFGDNCRRAGRAFALRSARPGDVVAFAARLSGEHGAALHLVGRLTVVDVLADVVADPGTGWWDRNAHVRRSRAGAPWDSFWVFRGDPAASGWLSRAIALDASLLKRLVPFVQNLARTEQQSIASHTRAIRRVDGPAEALLRELCVAPSPPSTPAAGR